jgi:capsular exopolysaccharide synthesis family protein
MDVAAPDPLRFERNAAAAPLDLNTVMAGLRRRLRMFIGVFVGVVILVAGVALLSTPRYTSTATVLILEHTPDDLHLNTLTPQDGGQTTTFGADSSAVDTQAKILQSRSLAAAVVDQLHLDQDPEFNDALRPPSRMAQFKRLIGLTPAPGAEDPAVAKQREREGVIDAVLRDLIVKRYEDTYTIDVAVTAFEPQKAEIIANAFVQRYLTQLIEAKYNDLGRGASWLNSRLTQLRDDLSAADAAVQQYKIDNNLMSAQGATLTEQEITNLDTQVAQARAQDAEQDARLSTAEHQLAAGSNGGDVGEAMTNPVVQTLRSQRAQVSAQLADLTAHYGPKFPDVVKTKQALADIDSQIHTEIQRVISNLKAQSQIAHSRTAAIVASTTQTRQALAGNNRALVRLDELQSNDDAARVVYAAFLDRYKEAVAKTGNEQADARLVSQAQLPTGPSSPNIKLAFVLALLLGFVAAAGAVLLAEVLKRGVSSVADAEQAFDLPCLAEIPTLGSTLDARASAKRAPDPLTYVVDKPLSRFSEAFRNLRASISSSRPGDPPHVVAITSALPGEGKTTTALCLARTAALAGLRVIIVDCDLRQRSLCRALKTEPKVGLLDVLNGAVDLRNAVVIDPGTGAAILPLAKSDFTPRDVFGTQAMTDLLAHLRTVFDLIILDTAPVLAVADTRVLCPKTDAVVFITRWRKTSRKAALTALRAVNDSGAYIGGVALTQVNVREQARVGEGASHYYRAYKKYYTS